MKNRIQYFDGLKGLSTLMVLFGHFVGAFTTLRFLKPVLGINLLLDGATAVHVFIMLSGMSICYSICNKTDIQKAIANTVLKRYMRLALPIVLPTIIAYILYRLGFMYNQQVAVETNNQWLSTLLPEHISVANFASSVVFGPIRSSLITPLWMMHYIFFGTFLIIPICICASAISKKLCKYGFLLLMSVIMLKYDVYYFSVVLGVILFVYMQDGCHRFGGGKYLSVIALFILVIALCFEMKFIHIIRAITLVTLIVHSPWLQRLLSTKPLQKLNGISYQIYLVHAPIICSWSCFFFITFGDSISMMALNLVSTIMLTLVFAILFTKIDAHTGQKLNEICKKVLQ